MWCLREMCLSMQQQLGQEANEGVPQIKVFLKILQISQDITCLGISF